MNKEELINAIKNIDDINKYSIKGGTSKFNKDYPNLLESINYYSKEMMVFHKNKTLVAKLTYLKNYFGDISRITQNGRLMIYDTQLKDFKPSNINSTKKQWDECKLELSNINECYSKEETIELLKEKYLNYLGKSGNRKLLRDNKKLYLSVYHHTKELDGLNKNLNKFSMRLYILVKNVEIYCKYHKKLKFWRFKNGEFKILCRECSPKYPSKEWYIEKYGCEWKRYSNERKLKLKEMKTNSLKWYIKKYGEIRGKSLYGDSVEKKINSIVKLKKNKYSIISQELFWDVYNKLNEKNDTYFQELNSEYIIRIPLKYKYNKSIMIVDFKKENKIIEYNGTYWHNPINDITRYEILNDMGYDVLAISSDEYNRNKKDKLVVEKCVKFLSCK